MNYLISVSAAALLIATSCSFSPKKTPQSANGRPAKATGFAVVELFTSEGCSSCPPADRTMAELAKEYAGKPVLFIGMHVDYWDRLGWKDPFSQHAFTARQNEYSNYFHSESVYTPQAVINGRRQMVGSSRDAITDAIAEGLKGVPGKGLALQVKPAGNSILQVACTVEKEALTDLQIVLLLVQRSATTKVQRGENGGRTLPHINVVRAIQYLPAKDGQASFNIPPGLTEQDVFIAGCVQDKRNGAIVGMQIFQ